MKKRLEEKHGNGKSVPKIIAFRTGGTGPAVEVLEHCKQIGLSATDGIRYALTKCGIAGMDEARAILNKSQESLQSVGLRPKSSPDLQLAFHM